jgi:hypothetical protein
MHAKRVLIFCLSAFLLIQPLVGFAQNPGVAPGFSGGPLLAPADPETLDLQTKDPHSGAGAIDPADIPDILMAEMKEVENNCAANTTYSSFHDCRCIAVKFLDARLKSDPERSKDVAFNSISSECPNTPGIAGYVYKGCADVMKNGRPNDFDKFCSCAANQVAEAYTKAPMMSMRYIDNLRKRAFINCGIGNNPGYNSPYLQK